MAGEAGLSHISHKSNVSNTWGTAMSAKFYTTRIHVLIGNIYSQNTTFSKLRNSISYGPTRIYTLSLLTWQTNKFHHISVINLHPRSIYFILLTVQIRLLDHFTWPSTK